MVMAGFASPSVDSAVAVFSVLALFAELVELAEGVDLIGARIFALGFVVINFVQDNGHLVSSQDGHVLVESVNGVTNSQVVLVNVSIVSPELLIVGHLLMSEIVVVSSGG